MEAKTKMIEEYRIHERDTGSADVQIALLTHRINHLTEHLQKKPQGPQFATGFAQDGGTAEAAAGLSP